MSSVLEHPATAPGPRGPRVVTPARRLGRLLAAVADGGLLWAAHQLLDWGWPGFLTPDYRLVLGLVTASLVAGIALNLALAFPHSDRFRILAELVTVGLAVAVALRLLEVFPFAFAGYATDWSWLLRVGLIAGIAVLGIATIANLVELLTGYAGDGVPGARPGTHR